MSAESNSSAAAPAPAAAPAAAASKPSARASFSGVASMVSSVAAIPVRPSFAPSSKLGSPAQCHSAEQFATLRSELKEYGVQRVVEDMTAVGWFAPEEVPSSDASAGAPSSQQLMIATAAKPFNPFARLVAGLLPAPYGDHLTRLGLDSDARRFFVAQNRPELDAAWDSSEESMVGRASMGARHQFLLLKSRKWSTFNVATFGLDACAAAEGATPRAEDLREAIALLDDMEACAKRYTVAASADAKASGKVEGVWSSNLGLFFHAYPLNSVHALHLHMLDLDATGPTFQALNYRNLSLQDARSVLQKELAQVEKQVLPHTRASYSSSNDQHNDRLAATFDSSAAHTHALSKELESAAAASSSAPRPAVAAGSAAAPFRIPIHLLRPGTTEATPPNFRLCLLDQMHTPEQVALRLANSGSAHGTQLLGHAASGHVASLSADRPTHDRLPLGLGITSRKAIVASGSDHSTASSSSESITGVSHVTLLQPSDADAWLAAQSENNCTVRVESVALAHASRCPCRGPQPTTTSAAGVASEAAAASSSSAAPLPPLTSSPQHQLRLAVVVVPTLLCTLHCSRCSPGLPEDVPRIRALVTRRPRHMRAFPGCWVFPGGACDPSDGSLEHTGAREVLEETGLDLAEENMRLVAMWEAVYPVIRPTATPIDGGGTKEQEDFIAKARYLIVMFTGPVRSGPVASTTADGGTTTSYSPPEVACLGCSVPVRLCPTEVDAGAWISGAELDSLRAHAAYFHSEREHELQGVKTSDSAATCSSDSTAADADQPRCQASADGHGVCTCAELTAQVTVAYAAENKHSTRIIDDKTAAPAPSSSPAAASSGASSSPAFIPARMRACALFGLYPNRVGSGMAEGHLVALEEMRARGLFNA